jgi:ATP/maltotriose-dependent transcriptional regulator MalT
MFLIDSAQDLLRSRPIYIADKITPPARQPRVSRVAIVEARLRIAAWLRARQRSSAAGPAPARRRWRWILPANCGRPVAWYKIDAPDADPQIFFNYLIRSIQQIPARIRRETPAARIEPLPS